MAELGGESENAGLMSCAWCRAGQGEIKMLSDKWLCVPRLGTMTNWPITEHNEGKPCAIFIKAVWMLSG